MQTEKAQSGEAGLAGWISTNDVTLFTMILVVVIALVMNSQVIRGKNENQQLTTEKNALTLERNRLSEERDELESDRDELTRQRDDLTQQKVTIEGELADLEARKIEVDRQLTERKRLLDETQEALKLSENESGQLAANLTAAMATISGLETDKTRLETDRAGLLDDKSALEAEQTRLLAIKNTLETDKEKLAALKASLEGQKVSLSDQLAALTVRLQEKVDALGDVEQQRDRLKEQADELDTIVATLEQKLNLSKTDMADLKGRMGTQLQDLQKVKDQEKARAEDYLARLRRAAELFKGLQADKRGLQSEVTNLEQRYQQQVARETTISRELVAVKGELKKVAFLFDASGSMKQQGTGTGDRWLEAQQIAATWLAHLDVDECVLIVYSTRVGKFPADGSFLRLSGPDGVSNRQLMLDKLKGVEPQGVTNTLDALRTAYAFEGLDSIVLFSDGAPTTARSGQFDPAIAEEIYRLCRQHPDIPINTIGLGNYFDKNMGTFLRSLAQITGGTFRGR